MIRRLTALGLLLSLFVTVPLSSEPPRAQAARRRPNVLLILTDDQRDGLPYMPFTRRAFIKTGRKMKRGVVTTPLCCPARASIFSGQYTHNHGVSDNRTGEELDQRFTLQAYLRDVGYRTGYFGKYFNDWPIERRPRHFNDWSIFGGKDPFYYHGGRWNIDGDVRRIDTYSTHFIEEESIDFLKKMDRKADRAPWMMIVAPTAPHHPYTATKKYKDARVKRWDGNPAVLEKNRSDKPPWVQEKDRSLADGRRVRRKQMRTLMSVDDSIKKIFEKMQDLDEQRDTFAIYISDNGYMWGEHGLMGKRRPYTPSFSVPFMMRYPGHFRKGSVERRWALNVDILPTVLDAANLDPVRRRRIDGRSLLRDGWSRRKILVEQGPEANQEFWASTVTRKYQYVEYYADNGTTVVYREYYNLKKDPWQLRNLFGDAKVANDPPILRLHRRLMRDRDCRGNSCP